MKNFIFSIVAVLVLCIGVFAIPKAVSPADMSVSASVAKTTPATAVSIDNLSIANFDVQSVTSTVEVAAIAFDQTNRTATVSSRINPTTDFATDHSPPLTGADRSTAKAFEHPDDKVPLGSPKPVEATARNGSPAVSRASPTSR